MIWMDLPHGEAIPKRGDRLQTTRTTYWVLTVRQVKRRDAMARPRVVMRVLKSEDVEQELREALLRSAARRGGSMVFEFAWYPRKKRMVPLV